ncbi:hypothetical protein PSAC2689_290006 [Paraburkholderia sacchari]
MREAVRPRAARNRHFSECGSPRAPLRGRRGRHRTPAALRRPANRRTRRARLRRQSVVRREHQAISSAIHYVAAKAFYQGNTWKTLRVLSWVTFDSHRLTDGEFNAMRIC